MPGKKSTDELRYLLKKVQTSYIIIEKVLEIIDRRFANKCNKRFDYDYHITIIHHYHRYLQDNNILKMLKNDWRHTKNMTLNYNIA